MSGSALVQILLVAVFTTQFMRTSSNACENDYTLPPQLQSSEQEVDETFFQLLRHQRELRHHRHRNVSETYLYGECNCTTENKTYCSRPVSRNAREQHYSSSFTAVSPEDVTRRSTCPYMVILTRDPDRIPALIREVKCLCHHCQLSGRRSVHSCRPVTYYKRVWRRMCRPSLRSYQFTRAIEPVTVGCVCTKETAEPIHPQRHSRY